MSTVLVFFACWGAVALVATVLFSLAMLTTSNSRDVPDDAEYAPGWELETQQRVYPINDNTEWRGR